MIFIGYIDKNNDTGPGNVLKMIMNQFEKNNDKYKFINICTKTKKDKLFLYTRLIRLLFIKNEIINIHSFGYKIPALVSKIARINKKSRFFLTLHGILSEEAAFEGRNGGFEHYFKNKEKYDSLEEDIIKNFPNIICVSEKEKNILNNKYNRFENIEVIYNGVNNYDNMKRNHEFINNQIKCIAGGGIYNRKGIFEMLSAVNYYNSQNEEKIYLNIYGDYESDEILEEYNEFISKYNLNEYVKYKFKVKSEEFIDKLSQANFCLAFSKFDTFNLTVLESMSLGVPAVVSRQCGAAEILEEDKDVIFLDFDEKYEESFMKKIKFIYNDKQKYYNLCCYARNKAKMYDWSNVYERYKKIFT